MRKICFYASLAALALASCDKDDDTPTDISQQEPAFYAYVLGEGNFNKNDASLTGIYRKDFSTEKDLYFKANGRALGDVGNDLIYDAGNGVMYVAVSNSEYVAKLDQNGVELARFSTKDNEELTSPRSLAVDASNLYVSTYGGHAACLDKKTLELKGMVETGSYSEEMAIIGNNLAVCNSGNMFGKTVNIIDTRTFSVARTVELPALNPQNIIAQGDYFYANTTEYGEDWSTSSTIVQIDPKTGTAKTVCDDGFLMAPMTDGKVLIVSSQTDWNTYQSVNEFKTYDPAANTLKAFALDADAAAKLTNASIYSLEADPNNGDIYVLCNNTDASFQATGSSLYVLSGNTITHEIADTGCLYASSVAFAR